MKTSKKKLTKAQKGMSTPPIKKVEYKSGNKTSFVQKNDKGTAISTYKTKNPVNKTEVNKSGNINPKTNTVSSGKSYKAGSYGSIPKYNVTSYSENKPSSVYNKSVDTTGYAAGKPTFTVNTYNRTAGKPAVKSSKTINRSQVKSLLNNMESSARKGKRGGIVKNKK